MMQWSITTTGQQLLNRKSGVMGHRHSELFQK